MTTPFQNNLLASLINGPSAHITGFEASWQQPLKCLPGTLNGMGVRANYGYTSSPAKFSAGVVPIIPRSCVPLRITGTSTLTYDKKGISARMGLTHNDVNLWS